MTQPQTLPQAQMPTQAGVPRAFITSRLLDAPRARAWHALTDAESMKQWWGPTGSTVVFANMDLRPGGSFHCCMRSYDGYKLWGKFHYLEVVEPERLVFLNTFSNAAGGVTRHPVVPTWPLETMTVVTFTQEPGDKATLEIHWSAHNATEAECKTFDASHASMRAGWTGTLDQLAAFLAKS